LGQIVTARVVLAAPLPWRDAEKRIRAYCRERLAAHKVPVKIEFVDSGLLNARQKTQRVSYGGGHAERGGAGRAGRGDDIGRESRESRESREGPEGREGRLQ